MGLIPGFEYDIFVSYAHADDLRDVTDPGWVGALCDKLRAALRNELKGLIRHQGRSIEVFWDYSLDRGQPLSEELKEKVRSSAIFLIILSDDYLHSGWCASEAKWFAEVVKERQQQDIWPIVKIHVGKTDYTGELAEMFFRDPGFDFYDPDQKNGDPRFAYPSIAASPDPKFWRPFNALQGSIAAKVKRSVEKRLAASPALAPQPAGIAAAAGADIPPSRPLGIASFPQQSASASPKEASVVFLSTEDLDPATRNVQGALAAAGLAGEYLPLTGPGAVTPERSASAIETATLALFGFGFKPGSDESVRLMQLAYEAAARAGKQLAWTHQGLGRAGLLSVVAQKDGPYGRLLDSVEKIEDGDVATLLPLIKERASSPRPTEAGGKKRIFVDVDKVDESRADELIKLFNKYGVDVALFAPRDVDSGARKAYMERCDGFFIIYDKVAEEIVLSKLEFYEKIVELQKKKRGANVRVAVLDSPPPPPLRYFEPDVQVIDFDPAAPEQSIRNIEEFLGTLGRP
jgi:hypothetical protein